MPIADPEEDDDADVQALLAKVGKPPEQASGSAGSAHQDSKSKADTSKYYGGSSKGWSSKWKGSWDKKSYWKHDQWESYYSSVRGSEQPKSPEEGPKKKEAEENEENLEETPKRPKINFGDRRVAGPLRIAKGRMGPASSEESQEEDVELEGLEPTDDELKAEAPNEEDAEMNPEEAEEAEEAEEGEEGQRGQMSCFLLSCGPPCKLPPRRDGPEGSNWCRVDFQTKPFLWVYFQEFQ